MIVWLPGFEMTCPVPLPKSPGLLCYAYEPAMSHVVWMLLDKRGRVTWYHLPEHHGVSLPTLYAADTCLCATALDRLFFADEEARARTDLQQRHMNSIWYMRSDGCSTWERWRARNVSEGLSVQDAAIPPDWPDMERYVAWRMNDKSERKERTLRWPWQNRLLRILQQHLMNAGQAHRIQLDTHMDVDPRDHYAWSAHVSLGTTGRYVPVAWWSRWLTQVGAPSVPWVDLPQAGPNTHNMFEGNVAVWRCRGNEEVTTVTGTTEYFKYEYRHALIDYQNKPWPLDLDFPF